VRVTLGKVVVVPVVSPVSAAELARFAARIAAVDGGLVVPVSAVPPDSPPEAIAAARDVVVAAADAAREHGVRAEGIVRSDLPVVASVLACMAEQQATLAVMGWQGASTHQNVFGELIDSIVGRSTIPLAVVRIHPTAYGRVVLPISEDHLLPGGLRGVRLAAELAGRLRPADAESVTILRTGSAETPLPDEVRALGDRVHHDRRRVDQAVGAAAGEGDLVVAPVAPTSSGLRTATTHMAWATPDAWLAVAIDVGPAPTAEDIADAVARAGEQPVRELDDDEDEGEHVVRVTARLDVGRGELVGLVDALRLVGTVGAVEDALEEDGRRCLHVSVAVAAPSANVAVGAVLSAVHESESLEGAEITYDVGT
jgi:hypothetical protein